MRVFGDRDCSTESARRVLFRALFILALFAGATPANAATFYVNSTSDANDASKGDGNCATLAGECTLRAAISEAGSLSGGPHTIVIPAGTYTITGSAGESSNNSGDYDITKPMTITGAGVDVTILNGAGIDRLFQIPSNSPVTISDLTVKNGAPPTGQGGCIYYSGNSTLTLTNIKADHCATNADGGAIYNNSGDIFLTNVTISNSTASSGKGGGFTTNSGTATLTGLTINGNSAVSGGGLYNQSGHVTMTNVTITGNTATNLGGGIYNQSGSGPTLVNVTINNNAAVSGGGIYSSSGNTTLKNSIVANSTSGGNCAGTIASNGYNLDTGSTCPFLSAGDKLNADPKLGVLQNNGGQTLTHALIQGSAAIDAGTANGAPTTDQRGFSRPQGGTFDMGAYEGTYIPNYKPDVMVKLLSEGSGSYMTDNVYEATASSQTKNGGTKSGDSIWYNLLFQNDGNMADTLKITGTGSGSGFTVQYFDESSVEQTAAVTSAGYSTAVLTPGGSRLWTLRVSPAGGATPVTGGTSFTTYVTATSATDTAKKDQVAAVTTSTSAKVDLVKSADKATVKPGEEISYTTVATNGAALTNAHNVVVTDSVPANTAFKVATGNASFTAGNSTLTCTIRYSRNNRTSWDYTPVPGGCSAPAPLDYCVTDLQWTTSGVMPANTSFTVGFTVRVR